MDPKPWEIAQAESGSQTAPPWELSRMDSLPQDPTAPLDPGAANGPSFGLPTQARTFGQGVTYAFGDEIEAGLRAALGPGTYEEHRDEIRAELDAYRKAHPGEAITMEVAGALIPGILTRKLYMNPAGKQTLGRAVAGGAVEGGLYGAGAFTGDSLVDMGLAIGGGSAIGIPGGAAGHYAGKLLDLAGPKFANFVREKFTGYGDAVQSELTRLVQSTGKTVDEVIDAVADGKIIAENKTLQAVIRAYKSMGGKAGAEVAEAVPAHRAATRQAAREALQENLTPGVDDNVYAAMRATDDQLRAGENVAYREVFDAHPELDTAAARQLEEILRQVPAAAKEVDAVYQNSSRLVPLFKVAENGQVQLTRIPSLEDAEIVRRSLKDLTTKAYKDGSGTLAENFKELELALRNTLDTNYGDLAAARAGAAQRRTIRDQFQEGQRAMGQSADKVAVDFQDVTQKGDDATAAYRAGVMDRTRHKMRQSPTVMTRLADPDRNEGAVLQAIFPEGQYDNVAGKLQSASAMDDLYQKVMHNSMTAPEQAAAAQIGSKVNAVDVMRLTQGDPLAVIETAAKLTRGVGGLSDNQRLQVVKVLFSQDPDFVRTALLDNTKTGALIERMYQLSGLAQAGGSTAINQQAAGGGLGILGLLEGDK